MVDSGSDVALISAPPEKCFAIAIDFEKYPQWASDVKEVTVLKRDAQGRALKVEYRASALGRSTHYTLTYDYSDAPNRLSWSLIEGDIMRAIKGAYTFDAVAEGTRATYEMAIELVIPLPGFVKRRAEMRILNTLKELKTRSEA